MTSVTQAGEIGWRLPLPGPPGLEAHHRSVPVTHPIALKLVLHIFVLNLKQADCIRAVQHYILKMLRPKDVAKAIAGAKALILDRETVCGV